MRSFIAIDFSGENKQALAGLQAELKQSDADVKWVDPGNIHLTLKFLGEVTDEYLPKVKEVLDKVVPKFKSFEINLSGIGVFPKLTYPRIVWAGIEKGKIEIKRIAEKLDEELSRLGFAKEDREFSAHLTIGRVRSGKNRDQLKKVILSTMDHGQWTGNQQTETIDQQVTSINLYQSTLTPQGPTYTCLHKADLRT